MIQVDLEMPLADQNIMEEKKEVWKVLSLTHVEYKVANKLIILMLTSFHNRRMIQWGSCLQSILFCR